MWVYLKVENDLENVNLDAFWYLIQIYWIFIILVARQNSRIDADHTANTKLYSDRPTKQNFINVCGLNLNLNLKKCLLDKKQIQAGNNVINDTYRVFYVGRPLQRRWAHRWRKSKPNILQCMNRHRAHELLTFWEHEFGIYNQNKSTPLGKAPSRHTRGTQLT